MQNILVTGSTRGIGKACADLLESKDARVIRHGTRSAEGQVSADFADEDAAEALWDAALSAADRRIDVLINNAGIYEPIPIEAPLKDWHACWHRSQQINLLAPADLCKFAVEHFRETGGGRIINIASRAAYRGDSINHAHYAAAKAGLVGLTKTLARGLAAENIYIFGITPGYVMTGMADDYLESRGGTALLADIPLGRVADPDEIASAAAYLALEAPPSMTGAIIDINGASFVR